MKLSLDEMLKMARLSSKHQFIILTGNAFAELLLSQSQNENKDPNDCFKELLENYINNGDNGNIYDFINILQYSPCIDTIINKEVLQIAIQNLKLKREKIILRYEQE